jgi:signal transduction histidine kinase/ligand-binding sensor domain-containing protein/CheY-like chemotaxis protein/AraC-like DNA-binding protein
LLSGFLFGRASGSQDIKYLGGDQGLSNNSVTSIYKDAYGFMWIGTVDGLNRYDGTRFWPYRNIVENSASIIDNRINKIAGLSNKIFVGTSQGLVYYNYNDAKFHSVLYENGESRKVSTITFSISTLDINRKGTVIIGTNGSGLFTFNPGEKAAHPLKIPGPGYSYDVQAASVDIDGRIFFCVRNVGLCQADLVKKTATILNRNLKRVRSLVVDAGGNVWVGTDSGLFKYDVATKIMMPFQLSEGVPASQSIADIKFAKDGHLWVGVDGGGVEVVDTGKRQIVTRLNTKNDPFVFKSDAVSALYQDNDYRMWIATLRGGLSIVDGRTSRFRTISHNPLDPNSLVNNFSLSFCEDEKNNIWIGTDGGGLSYWDRRQNNFTNFVHKESPGSLASNFVVSIIRDRNNTIWLGLFYGGVARFDQRTKHFIHYSCINPRTGNEDNHIWKLYQDSKGRLWAGTTGAGSLYLYNDSRDRFEIFDERLTDIQTIYEDHAGALWVGGYSGLVRIDISKKKHLYISTRKYVRAITEDDHHFLWVGTEGDGLLKFDQTGKFLYRYSQRDGLPSNSILNILFDKSGNLWASTFNGLTEYNVQTHKFRNFDTSDGLQSKQFNFNAALKLTSGELLFGGMNGFNIFYPDSIQQNVYTPAIRLTDIKVNNESIEGDSAFTDGLALIDLRKITIPFEKATLAIDYTAPEYSFAEKLQYAYYMEGWDHSWNNVGSIKTAYYTRLDQGSYTLHLRVTNTEGNWTGKQLLLQITVLPPWYRTWWAFCVYFAIVGTLIYMFWIYRLRQARLKYEVEIANLKMERQKELNEKKLSFFTNVSHELRTPLTLIINPIKDMLKKKHENDDELRIVYKNANRLLGLVDQLLLFRKVESETDSLQLGRANIVMVCREVFSCFIHHASIKNIHYTFECEEDIIEACIDREKIEIALFNVITNAFKFTPDGGSIRIILKSDERLIYFVVADSGIGISAEVGERLFEKFYQVKDANSLKTGFGIGLYLVKTFIEAHQGTISFSSVPTEGTTFTLQFPKGDFGAIDMTGLTNESRQTNEQLVTRSLNEEEVEDDDEAASTGQLNLLISGHQTILVIDDNHEIRNYIKKIFSQEFTVLEASDGSTGLAIIRKQLPDVIISDVVMPGLDGLELCRIVKQDSALSHIPIILLTGESFSDNQLKGLEEGAADFLSKPFDKDLLIARVKGIVKNRAELQRYFYNEVTQNDQAKNLSEENKDFLYRCIKIIEDSLLDTDLEVDTIAGKMGMGYSSLYKKIKQVTGMSLNSFIRFVSLRKAAELMINTNCNVNEAAFRTGFNDPKYFRKLFNKQFGLNPSEFIKRHRTAFQKSYRMDETQKTGL